MKDSQKKAAKNVIKRAPAPIRQDVLIALAYAITAGTVNNPIGYLTALVNRANDGTFEPVKAAKKQPTSEERIKAEAEARKRSLAATKVDNLTFYKNLFKQYGKAALPGIPEMYRQIISGGASA